MKAKIETTAAMPGSVQRMVRRWWRKISGADTRLATGLLGALSAETLYKSDCFDYICWLGETQQRENVKEAPFLVLASDGTTCWGKTYAEAVKVAMQHDKELYEAVQNLELPDDDPPNEKAEP